MYYFLRELNYNRANATVIRRCNAIPRAAATDACQ
jgi:hypothetical protein